MFKKLQGMTHGQVLRSPINPAGTSERPDVKNPNSTVDVQPGGLTPPDNYNQLHQIRGCQLNYLVEVCHLCQSMYQVRCRCQLI